jgi:hypothetical protein
MSGRPRRSSRALAALACACVLSPRGASAQRPDDRGGLVVSEVSVSSGYGSVQLPPLTLGGTLPTDALNADLITSAEAQIDWSHVSPRSRFDLQLLGAYTARTRYSQLNAPTASIGFGASRAVGKRWRIGAAVTNAIASSDPLTFQPSAARGQDDDATVGDAAATLARVRSPAPDAFQSALFVPINQSIDGSDLAGERVLVSGAKASAVYTRSVRLETAVHGNYTTVRSISSTGVPGAGPPVADSTAQSAGVAVKYGRAERSRLTATFDWSRVSGLFSDEAVFATVGYEWTGRQWFTAANVGLSVRPFAIEREGPGAFLMEREGFSRVSGAGGSRDWAPSIVGSAFLGRTTQSHTVFVQYSRASHDQYGNGGRNVVTGFEGDVQAITGSWFWSAPRGRWMTQTDVSMIRRPGNFSYIYAWLGTLGVGRQLGSDVRLMGELLFDRHGSRGFEGFHLTREGARLNLVWTPRRRQVAPDNSDH